MYCAQYMYVTIEMIQQVTNMLPHPLPTHFPLLHTQNYNRQGWFRRLFGILTEQVVPGGAGK